MSAFSAAQRSLWQKQKQHRAEGVAKSLSKGKKHCNAAFYVYMSASQSNAPTLTHTHTHTHRQIK